jgi:hypothetical protein
MKLTRRKFLRAAGVSLALPWLDSLAPRQAFGAAAQPPRRMVCVCAPLGLYSESLFPSKAGADYPLSPYLEVLKDFRNDFTVMSGLSHPEVPTGHDSIVSFLTGAHHRGFLRPGFRNTISLDQFAADKIGGQTRFPSLALCAEGNGLSWTRSGAMVPSNGFPASVFRTLFLPGTPDQVQAQTRRLQDGQSILDSVRDEAKKLRPALGSNDRQKLDDYFTSVEELEGHMRTAQVWALKPKPKVDYKEPQNPTSTDLVGKTKLMYDLVHLALQTDSTRLVTFQLLGTSGVPPIAGVTQAHHDLSHHGKDPAKIEQLKKVDMQMMITLRDLLAKLKQTKEQDANLLDRTMVFFSSNLGNGSGHATTNLPVILAGGGFKHGRHLAFDAKNNKPMCNLYVSMLQRLGINATKFGSSTGTLTGLETR